MAKKKSKKTTARAIGSKIGAEIDKAIEKGCCEEKKIVYKHSHNDTCGAFYGLGVIGAAVYYISTASGFWVGVLGVLKALVWPAFVV